MEIGDNTRNGSDAEAGQRGGGEAQGGVDIDNGGKGREDDLLAPFAPTDGCMFCWQVARDWSGPRLITALPLADRYCIGCCNKLVDFLQLGALLAPRVATTEQV